MSKTVDFLVIGTGIAGLSYALKVADKGNVLIISKTKAEESNTRYAQGGIASVLYKPDTHEKHIKDTIQAGNAKSNPEIVKMVITESTDRLRDLINWGTHFDKNDKGQYDLHKEGGHSEYRVLHHKDNTGNEIMRALLSKIKEHKNIELLENHFAVDIITQHHLGEEVTRRREDIKCYGAYVLNIKKSEIITIRSKFTMIATGGLGCIYKNTTNPKIATGDGIAMVYRAKGYVDNMEFIQFHPTSLYNPKNGTAFLITEAIRGFGAILKNIKGNEFMHKYDKRGCLAPRDIVARAIDSEMKTHGSEYVYLDCTHLNGNELENKFPNIYKHCLEIGIDIKINYIPVVPAAHYVCGGIRVDKNGESTIQNLYASGECSSTGLHGSNRLASNSLLEAAVYSHRAAMHSNQKLQNQAPLPEIPEWNNEGMVYIEEMVLITQNMKEVQEIMSSYVGIVRSNLRLERALRRLEIIYKETEELYQKSVLSKSLCELRNSINVAYLTIKKAKERHESIGLHYNIDFPPNVEK